MKSDLKEFVTSALSWLWLHRSASPCLGHWGRIRDRPPIRELGTGPGCDVFRYGFELDFLL